MQPDVFEVLNVPVHATTLSGCTDDLIRAVDQGEKGWVIFRDVHGVIRCQDDPEFLRIHQEAYRVCPDGMPLVWIGRRAGHRKITRVYGPDLMRSLMQATQDGGHTHFFYGGAPGIAEKLKDSLELAYPGVRIVGTFCPPYAPLSSGARARLLEEIDRLQPDFFWVGLSTPKQERFMSEMCGVLNTRFFLGVGAAFDYLSGTIREPPAWIRRSGLQWLVRIATEPRRLLKRYLIVIPRFLFLYIRQR